MNIAHQLSVWNSSGLMISTHACLDQDKGTQRCLVEILWLGKTKFLNESAFTVQPRTLDFSVSFRVWRLGPGQRVDRFEVLDNLRNRPSSLQVV